MAEELQDLLDKIQKDGVEKAEQEATKIISDAEAKAKQILSDAEAKVRSSLEDAEREGASFQQRAEKALEQTARDVVLSVGESVDATMKRIIDKEVSGVMTADDLKAMLASVVDAYCKNESGDVKIDVLVNPDQQESVKAYFTSQFASEMKKGLDIKSDASVTAGFKVSLVNDNIHHDFTSEAITDVMCELLRPHLAQIVKTAQKK